MTIKEGNVEGSQLGIAASESDLLRDTLRSDLVKMRDLMSRQMKNPREFHYQGMPDFILREGEFFEPQPLPTHIGYWGFRHCYKNAFRTALEENIVYVEGYAVSSSNDIPMLHAWNLDADGFVVDRSWNRPGRIYLAFIFPLPVIPIT